MQDLDITIDPAPPAPKADSDLLQEPIPGLPPEALVSSQKPGPALPRSRDELLLTFQLRNVPLLVAVQYLATQSGMWINVQKDGLHLRQYSNCCDSIPTMAFDLTPEVLGAVSLPEGSPSQAFFDAVVIRRENPRAWFEAHDVTFPPGCSVNHLPDSHRVLVRSITDNLAQIAILLDD